MDKIHQKNPRTSQIANNQSSLYMDFHEAFGMFWRDQEPASVGIKPEFVTFSSSLEWIENIKYVQRLERVRRAVSTFLSPSPDVYQGHCIALISHAASLDAGMRVNIGPNG